MEYKNPKLTADGIIFRDKSILLVKRKNEPYKGQWTLPGGFVEYGETTENTAIREVYEETGLKTKILELSGVYSDPNRDPRGHIITIAYILEVINGEIKANDDALDAKFFKLSMLPELAFDHKIIVKDAVKRFYNGILSQM